MSQQVLTVITLIMFGVCIGIFAHWLFTRAGNIQHTTKPELADFLGTETAAMLTVLSPAFVLLDADFKVLHAAEVCRDFGLITEYNELLDLDILTLVQAAQTSGQVQSGNFPAPDGTPISVRVSRVGNTYPARRRNLLVVFEDRSREYRVEATRRDFIANVSHELKTPVGAISLLAETIQDAADDPVAVKRFAGRLQQESARLSDLVRDIIELSRVQSGAPGLGQPSACLVSELVSDAVQANQAIAAAKDIELLVDINGDPSVLGHADLLSTAVSNLIRNAISYSPPATQVQVTALRIENEVQIQVKDEGFGIAPADQERIFERFFRVDQARSRQTGGTGLGLSIVKHIAQDHHGRVELISVLGHGSTFSLIFPVHRSAE